MASSEKHYRDLDLRSTHTFHRLQIYNEILNESIMICFKKEKKRKRVVRIIFDIFNLAAKNISSWKNVPSYFEIKNFTFNFLKKLGKSRQKSAFVSVK